ncbi:MULTISPECIES: hypothetical protein [Pseudomonas]|uniref:hypothetical protein n=1 Tax=Pseudomonas TaxID=286 RepID=UPI000B362116|nr:MULTISPECIES: hypothetical protein [Pseudomonas]PMY67047.1 hypothetical protein C1Y32_20115 [Pseudomonas sp. FW126-L8]PMY68100.1 hypothetical protein C1Y31_07580 [Pseudomonas sp. FW305-25]PNA78346.1 hypothetical protein C1Y33_15875 [Pseudomonas sp. FW305-76]
MSSLLAFCDFSFLAGGSIKQQIAPLAEGHPGFTEAYRDAVQAKSLQIEVLPSGTRQVNGMAK